METIVGRAECSGLFKVVLRNDKGEIKQESDWNNNLLLNHFFTFTSSQNNLFARVGTGTTPPTPADTGLASPVGSVSANNVVSGSNVVSGNATDGYMVEMSSRVFSWPLGAITANISEFVLTNTDSASYTPFVRSLIKDSEGTPTTITVTASDQLEIWWKLNKKWLGSTQMSDVTQSFTLNGVATDVTCKNFNPSELNNLNNFEYSVQPKVLVNGIRIKTLVTASAAVTAITSGTSGTDLTDGVSGVSEQSSNYYSGFIATNPSAGVAKITKSHTFDLFSSAASSPMLGIVLDTYNSTAVIPARVIAALTFSPQFTKGADKVLTVAFSYTVSRAP